MAQEKPNAVDAPAELAKRITEALLRERVVPRFVDSYVVENGRHALQVHASLYRDLLTLLQREALLALTVRALAIVCDEPRPVGKAKPRQMLRRDATLFRRKFLARSEERRVGKECRAGWGEEGEKKEIRSRG